MADPKDALHAFLGSLGDDAREKAKKAKGRARRRHNNVAGFADLAAGLLGFAGQIPQGGEGEQDEDEDDGDEGDFGWAPGLNLSAEMLEGEAPEEILRMAKEQHRLIQRKFHPDKAPSEKKAKYEEICRKANESLATARAKYG